MDQEDENKRLLRSVDQLQELLGKFNDELEDRTYSNRALEAIKSDVESVQLDIRNLKERVRDLEVDFSKSQSKSEVQDPKLQRLPNRDQLEESLDEKINYRTLIAIGSIITFFVSIFGTVGTILTMIYLGAIGG